MLMRMNLCPVLCARYSTRLVLPLDVGPCSKIGWRRSSAARAKDERCVLTPGVTTYRPDASGSSRCKLPPSTQYCSMSSWVPSGGAAGALNIACVEEKCRGQYE